MKSCSLTVNSSKVSLSFSHLLPNPKTTVDNITYLFHIVKDSYQNIMI